MKIDDLNANRFVLDNGTASGLRRKIREDAPEGIRQAARQFEGLLLQMMMKSMREATPQDGLLDSDQTRFFTAILDQQMAHDLSARGALGFARLIEEQLGRATSSEGGDALDAALDRLQQSLFEHRAASSAAGIAGVAPVELPESEREYVDRVWPHAVEAAKALGVPPHFLVAHSALESGWGRNEIRRSDGSPSYNVFGIKAGSGWQGPTVEAVTTEYVDGAAQTVREKFRAYGSYGEAFRDYAGLLRGNSRFSEVLGQQDGARFARSLQRSGYATDPGYADKLARIIGGTTLRRALTGQEALAETARS
ncbi:MAG: flagellar assembly peptidoglycan hydrolase FlgJ [Candidatus Accumulibacter sp.]|jgi:flagellar protein FlgJ|nr:flagellar assembly peptidoglycan hydrolase FlgJ [Accumulibacter sp.]